MKEELLINHPIDEVVMQYAENAKIAGLDGVVCSPLEAGKVHNVCGNNFVTVTPGVRFADSANGDQKRVTTPERAKELQEIFTPEEFKIIKANLYPTKSDLTAVEQQMRAADQHIRKVENAKGKGRK